MWIAGEVQMRPSLNTTSQTWRRRCRTRPRMDPLMTESDTTACVLYLVKFYSMAPSAMFFLQDSIRGITCHPIQDEVFLSAG
jgi:hypothetical protein